MSCNQTEVKDLLLEAVRYGNIEDLTNIVNQYGLSYCQDLFEGYVLLCEAIQCRHSKVATFLLEKGAKWRGETASALHLAVEERFVEIIHALLKHGAEINCSRIGDNFAPLHIACDKGSDEIVNLLLINGADPDIKATDSTTPLHLAAQRRYLDIIEILLSYGAEINCLRILDNHTPLHIACRVGAPDIVDYLLNHGADPHIGANYDCTPLHIAAMGLCLVTTDNLKCGTDRKCVKSSDNLHIACKQNSNEIIRILLNYGTDPNIKTKTRITPLHLAADSFLLENVETLLKYGADVNCSRLEDNYTPLHIACVRTRGEMVLKLLDGGADPNVRSCNNETPLHLACKLGHSSVKLIEALLKYGADMHCSRFQDNFTPLHIASGIKDGHTCVSVLLKNGANPNIKASKNRSPLHVAAQQLNLESLELLLNNLADINAIDSDGFTPLCLVMGKKKSFTRPRGFSIFWDVDDYKCGNKVVKTFMKHAIKLKAIGLYVSYRVLHLLRSDPHLQRNFQQECVKELSRMKCVKVSFQFTVHELLSSRKNPVFARDKSLMKSLASFSFEEFPIYQYLLLHFLEKSKRRIELMTSAEKSLDFILKTSNVLNRRSYQNLPVELLTQIVAYLSDKELRNLNVCGEDVKRQLCR